MCMVNRYDDGHCDFLQSQTPTNNNELVESLIREHNNPAQETRNPNYNGSDSTYKYYMIFILTLHVACCLCLLRVVGASKLGTIGIHRGTPYPMVRRSIP